MSHLRAILKNNIPFRRHIRMLKRKIIPYRSNAANDSDLQEWSMRMVSAIAEAGGKITGARVVEIGSGWVPILPMIFRMAGASNILTIDQDRLMDLQTFRHAIISIRKNMHHLLQLTGVRPDLIDMNQLPKCLDTNLEVACENAGITYCAPADFINLPPSSADFIVSRTVLEHIPENLLRAIFDHAAKVLRPGGMMCHQIDMSDHFEHKDKSISTVDMLHISDEAWAAKTKDPQDYQNRLRRFEFASMLKDGGWDILRMDGEPYLPAMTALKTMKVIPRYATVPHEELAVLWSVVVARRPLSPTAAANVSMV